MKSIGMLGYCHRFLNKTARMNWPNIYLISSMMTTKPKPWSTSNFSNNKKARGERMPRLNHELYKLNQIHRCQFIRHLYWLHARQFVSRLPCPMRLGLLQVPIIFLFALGMPPVSDLPHIVIPILWCASFCVALTLLLIMRGKHARSTPTPTVTV
jgi:hypothetical protein